MPTRTRTTTATTTTTNEEAEAERGGWSCRRSPGLACTGRGTGRGRRPCTDCRASAPRLFLAGCTGRAVILQLWRGEPLPAPTQNGPDLRRPGKKIRATGRLFAAPSPWNEAAVYQAPGPPRQSTTAGPPESRAATKSRRTVFSRFQPPGVLNSPRPVDVRLGVMKPVWGKVSRPQVVDAAPKNADV